jgi:hypothetical protein
MTRIRSLPKVFHFPIVQECWQKILLLFHSFKLKYFIKLDNTYAKPINLTLGYGCPESIEQIACKPLVPVGKVNKNHFKFHDVHNAIQTSHHPNPILRTALRVLHGAKDSA